MVITVFTPTYNRAYIIEKLYRSLQTQSYKSFEWIVIDDGSTDNTERLFDTWQKEDRPFEIIYKKVENGGKHRAINKAVNIAKGELFFIVDSDDYLTDDALEKVVNCWNSIENKTLFCGVSGLKAYNFNDTIGKTFNSSFVDCTSLEREKNNIYGDKAEVFKTDILKQFPFKEFDGENFLTENTVWYEIAGAGYRIRWFNEVIYICNYLEDGLSKNLGEIVLKNLEGEIYTINIYKKYNKLTLRDKIWRYSVVCYAAAKKGISKKVIAKRLNCTLFFLFFADLLRFSYEIKKTILRGVRKK